jgi:hypothetical protein
MRDDDVRSPCFAALDVLQAKVEPGYPDAALAEGLRSRGRWASFLNRARGIHEDRVAARFERFLAAE